MQHNLESTKKPRPLLPLLSFHLLSGVFNIVLFFSCHNFLLKYRGEMEEKASFHVKAWLKGHNFRNKHPSTEESYRLGSEMEKCCVKAGSVLQNERWYIR